MDIQINGPKVIFELPIFGGINVTETTVNAWIIIVVVFLLSLLLTSKLEKIPRNYRQKIAEKIVTGIDDLVEGAMGIRNMAYAPYILTLMVFSIFGSLISMVGLRSITADINTTLGWALMTFIMIYRAGFKHKGVGGHLKGLIEPVPFMLPLNLISELATPVSLSLRHYGNILSGAIITFLAYTALASASSAIWPGGIPFLQLGIPAMLSSYFDLFSGLMQAYVFSMLTMVYVSNANDPE